MGLVIEQWEGQRQPPRKWHLRQGVDGRKGFRMGSSGQPKALRLQEAGFLGLGVHNQV